MSVMKNKKNRVLLCMAVLVVLGAVAFTAVHLIAAEAPKLSEVSIKSAYPVDTVLTIPEAVFTLKDETKEAYVILHMPDESAFHDDEVTLSQTGKYTLEYSGYFNGRRYAENFEFQVYTQTYTVRNAKTGSAEYYENYALTEYDGSQSSLSGLLVELPAGAVFSFNKIIDFSDKTAQDDFIKFAILPQETGFIDASYLYFVLTDAHDSTNYITLSFHDMEYNVVQYGQSDNYDNMRKYWYSFMTSYAKAGSNFQQLTGLNAGKPDTSANYGAMCGPSFHGVAKMDYSTGLSSALFAENGFKTIALDYSTKELYVGSSLVIDFDNPKYFTELWEGFDTGEAILSVYFGNYAGSDSARIFFEDIDGNDLSDNDLYDAGAPEITVEEPEEGIYDGVVGYAYPVFGASAMDSYDGALSVNTSVYYNYNSNYRQLMNIENDKFIPDREGFYSLVYEAEDFSGNQTTKIVNVRVVADAEDMLIELTDVKETATVGTSVDVASSTVKNAFGKVVTDVVVVCREQKSAVGNGSFMPKVVGTYEVTYKAKDALGRTATLSYEVEIQKSNAPVFYETPDMPKYLMAGKSYCLPEMTAVGYVKSDEGIEIKAKVYVNDKAGRREITDGVYTPAVNTSGEKVTIEYVATEGANSGTLKMDIPCFIVSDGKNIDITGYFAVDSGVTVSAEENHVKVTTARDNSGFEFINALITNSLDLELTVDKLASAFEKLHIFYEDSINPEIAVKLTVTKTEDGSEVSINDSADAYSLGFSYINESTSFLISLNEAATAFSFPNERKTILIKETLGGKAFTGFTSGKVYVRVVFEGVIGASAIKISKLNGQPMQALTTDKIAPKVGIMGEYKNSYEMNTEITLYRAFAGDVLEPSVTTFVLSVRDPKGTAIVENLDLLKEENAAKNITLKLEEYGSYTVSYTAMDASGRKLIWSQNLNVKDDIAPVITVEDKLPKTGTVGKKVAVSDATATDNVDGDVMVYTFLENPEGAISLLSGTGRKENAFTPKMTGKYFVKYVAFDNTNNMTIETYTITVK